ncbi:MAG: hypothetical protein V7751_06345 [Pseudoalteromonas distincta]
MGRKARQNWYRLYRSINPRISSYAGDESVYQVIRQEATAAGYEEKVLKRMLRAGAFLDRVAPALDDEKIKCGYAHVELLERLYKLDSARALTRLDAVLLNEVTLQDLRDEITQKAAAPGQAQTAARSKARQRIGEHRRDIVQRAQHAGPGFFGHTSAEFVLVHRFRSLGRFLLLDEPNLRIAVIPRLGDTSLKESKATDQLIKLALSYRRYFHRVWFVFPGESSLTREVVAQAHEIDALDDWLFLAIPDEDSAGLVHYRDRRQLLHKRMHGITDNEWEGTSLIDDSPRRGILAPLNKN